MTPNPENFVVYLVLSHAEFGRLLREPVSVHAATPDEAAARQFDTHRQLADDWNLIGAYVHGSQGRKFKPRRRPEFDAEMVDHL